MTPTERKAHNRRWRDAWGMAERWEASGTSPEACARELKEWLLSQGKPQEPGRPRSKGWV